MEKGPEDQDGRSNTALKNTAEEHSTMDGNLDQQPNKEEIGSKTCSVLHDEVQVMENKIED